ncbi:hypothetical protein CPLU01_11721 [Colletotrichum plurivorum]|uniref:Uncharacterized protein n=1 Tax=Colletotrichum plurivorum TaxID=2175906 RepID=A0A8H6K1U7_9PEZI|nr:hypothetical protein CPLU01_11721 [Colletotrichum plurivorum]
MAGIEYERFSSAFPLRMNDTIHDKFECCLRFKLYAISDTFLATGEYTYEPSADDEHRRFTRTRRLLALKLNDLLQIWLPPEILTPIAGLLVRECAIVTSEEQSLGKGASDTSIDLSSDVYESYHVVDGVRYIRSLFNSTSKVSEDEHHVLARKAGQPVVHKIWIAEDHRGIRDVLVSGDTASEITNNYTGWASPEHPAEIIDLRTLGPLNEHPERLRMNAFSCNIKGTTGYTVATHGHSVAMIHAHGCDDDNRFYGEMDVSYPMAFLIHMPIDDGEYVTEICRRYALDPVCRPSVCLVDPGTRT